jgi:ubiquinone/menaquinone biosynthesis C-methylase UbiE
VLATLAPGDLLIDYSSGTGILTRRLVESVGYPVGILNVDASPKFLRVALESFRDDERVAFRLLRWLKAEKRLQSLDEVAGPGLLDRGADAITSTNAIHLYYDLDETLASWARTLRPGGLAFICSGNMRNPHGRPDEWIIDETVARVNDIAADIVQAEPAFAEYRQTLDDAALMSRHAKLREKVFVPVRPLEFYPTRSGTPGSACSSRGNHLRPRRRVVPPADHVSRRRAQLGRRLGEGGRHAAVRRGGAPAIVPDQVQPGEAVPRPGLVPVHLDLPHLPSLSAGTGSGAA